jgi:uncharacterized protein YoxC
MPDITILHIVVLTLMTLVGVLLGWLARGRRAVQEKRSLAEGWKEQLDTQRKELARLIEQNRGLGEQVSQSQAAHKDATNRARELASALKEAFERRDELQRQIKEIRNNLEGVLAERRKLESDVQIFAANDSHLAAELREKDQKIFALSRDLESWQDRLPPLIQRFRDRDDDARRLESALDRANERIMELESGARGNSRRPTMPWGAGPGSTVRGGTRSPARRSRSRPPGSSSSTGPSSRANVMTCRPSRAWAPRSKRPCTNSASSRTARLRK